MSSPSKKKYISMTNNNNQISVTYTDAELRNLIEEFITQRKEDFSLRDVCSCILYWGVEDGKTTDSKALVKSNELSNNDQDRIKKLLEAIVSDGRIGPAFTDDSYLKL